MAQLGASFWSSNYKDGGIDAISTERMASRERVRTMIRDLHSKHRSPDWRGLAELGLFSAGIIHEVKNSLQGLANALFLLESDAELKPRAREHVAIARHELSRAFDIS